MPRPSLITIRSIKHQFDVSFADIIAIAEREQWKVIDDSGINFYRQTVYDYFNKQGIAPKTLTYKEIMQRWGIDKQTVLKTIAEQKWQPVFTGKTVMWRYPYKPIAEFFNKNNL